MESEEIKIVNKEEFVEILNTGCKDISPLYEQIGNNLYKVSTLNIILYTNKQGIELINQSLKNETTD